MMVRQEMLLKSEDIYKGVWVIAKLLGFSLMGCLYYFKMED